MGDDTRFAPDGPSLTFQSTSPRGGRPIPTIRTPLHQHFNPRPHVGDDRPLSKARKRYSISIHVPTWGTTRYGTVRTDYHRFQSTSPRGGRLHARIPVLLVEFQSTSPRGGRQKFFMSINRQVLFQSTSPRGGRLGLWWAHGTPSKFQSTSPRGGRPEAAERRDDQRDFNPRPHVGDDEALCKHQGVREISIHVPTWGTTLYRSGT